MFSEEIKKTTATLYKGDKFIGSGIIFKYEGNLYAITAAHNIYGKKFDLKFVQAEWSVSDYRNISHTISGVNQNVDFSKVNDIALLQLNHNGTDSDYAMPHFAPMPQTKAPAFFFRGKYGIKQEAVNKGNIHFQENHNVSQFKFFGVIEKEQLLNSSFAAGSEWLAGMSGSGLFLSDRNDIICSGILLEIPDKGDNGQVLLCSVAALPFLGLEIPLLPDSVYSFNSDYFSDKWFGEKLSNLHKCPRKTLYSNTEF